MKLRILLLTAALFVSAGIASAADTNDTADYDSITFGTAADSSVKVTLFRMNNGWTYSICGYKAGDANNAPTYEQVLNSADGQLLSAAEIDAIGLPDEYKANIIKFSSSHGVYAFSVDFNDDEIEKLGLKGEHGNQIVYSAINKPSTDQNEFIRESDGNILYYGKTKWNGKFNNGAVFVVAAGNFDGGETFGQPLPAPVVTLLIALGFGAALVMYRNRKQVNA